MCPFLHASITPETIVEAKKQGIIGDDVRRVALHTYFPRTAQSIPHPADHLLDALEQACATGVLSHDDVTPDVFEGFMSKFGRAFYGVEEKDAEKEFIVLEKKGEEHRKRSRRRA